MQTHEILLGGFEGEHPPLEGARRGNDRFNKEVRAAFRPIWPCDVKHSSSRPCARRLDFSIRSHSMMRTQFDEPHQEGEGEMPRTFQDDEGPLGWDDVPELLEELRDMAKRLLARWPNMHSLQPTLLVATALRRQRLSNQTWDEVTWDSRREFFAHVHRAMRHKLVEYRRHQRTPGYAGTRIWSVADLELYNNWRKWTEDPDLAAALDRALESLRDRKDLRDLVEHRFFDGLTWPEIAEMLEVSLSSVRRGWAKVRVILEDALRTVRLDAQPV